MADTEMEKMNGEEETMEEKQEEVSPVEQLFERIKEEIEDNNPENVIYFTIEFLCKHYPNHVHGLASVFAGDTTIQYEMMAVREFMRSQKVPTEIVEHFIASGFDNLETMETVTPENMSEIEKDNNAKWLPGHKVRLEQVFSDAKTKIKNFRDEKEAAVKSYMSFQQAPQPQMNMPMPMPMPMAQVPPPSTVYMTQQAPQYPSVSFKTQFTPSSQVTPLNKTQGGTFKYAMPAGAMMKM